MLFKVKSHTSSSVRLNVLAIIEYSSDKVMENTPLSSVCKVMCKKNVNALYIECQIISVMFNTAALFIDGLYGLYKLSALLTVCILSTYEASIHYYIRAQFFMVCTICKVHWTTLKYLAQKY